MTHPGSAGLCEKRLQHLRETIAEDISQGLYTGAAIAVTRHGEPGMVEAQGTYSSIDDRKIDIDSVFSLFSLTKAFTNVLILRAVEMGRLALTTKVVDIIPEFKGLPREHIRLDHLLTHRTGLPSSFTPIPGLPIDRLDVVIDAICEKHHGLEEPGGRVAYSPMAAHALMGEMLRRTDPAKRSYREIVHQDLFDPLGMTSTAIGVRKDLKPRHILPEFPPNFSATHPSSRVPGENGAFEDEHGEMPWVGGVSTIPDLVRFAEALRRGGELDGNRVLSPRMLDMATINRTGEAPNELYKAMALMRGWLPYPAYIGLGFSMRGTAICQHQFGTMATPRAFGNHGAGSTVFWVDPELDMTFACLTTHMMPEPDNILRFQRLSDIAISAAI